MTQTEPSHAATLAAPRAWVVARRYGVESEVWMRRQIELMSAVRPRVVCWEQLSMAPRGDISVVAGSARWDSGPGRWITRLAGLPSGNCFASRGKELTGLIELARTDQPTVLLCHFGHVALRMLPVSRETGIPLVAHFHGLDLSSMLRNRWYRHSLWSSLSQFAAAIVVGSHQKRLLLEHGYPAQRIHLIPCGVPVARFTPRSSPRADGPFRFIGVSRLVEWKGAHIAVRALASVVRRGVDARLDLVGDGPMMPTLRALAGELGLSERVGLLGSRSSDDVLELLRGADAFVQHSIDAGGSAEGFGVSITEASACGLPVVATRCGGIQDQVIHAETGLLVAQRDEAAMADAMATLAQDPELCARLGAAGRIRAAREYDAPSQVRKLEAVMLGAADARKGSSR